MKVSFTIQYNTAWGESLSLVIGGKKYPMNWGEAGVWSVTIDTNAAELKSYGYVVMKDGLIDRYEWDNHSSRLKKEINDAWIDCPIEGCRFKRKHQAARFDDPSFRGAGTAVPVFSLRSKDDFGIGEFNDLKYVIDWAAATGQCIVQLLPVNDTTRKGDWKDSYPYSPISSFALHPLYINLQAVGVKQTKAFKAEQEALNALEELDYPRVYDAKMRYLHDVFHTKAAKDMASKAYQSFIRENAYWLDEYSTFCAKRDASCREFYDWTQYHLDKQFASVAKYARSKGISLKGDLPIGVSANSADAYYHPQLFNLDSTAGAPPDFFSADGQNWGFPTYNWEEMAKDDYAWWKSRLRKMAEYFDAFRIDHILGFFRIWEIPVACCGSEGHFNPALPYSLEEIKTRGLQLEGLFHEDPRNKGMYQPYITPHSASLPQWQQESFGTMYNEFFFHRNDEFWRRNAEKKLPELLTATGMLACGEDLGMVPACVPGVMAKECILSLKMRGMENEGVWNEMSVCATSSHDMETLRMQCKEDPTAEEQSCMLWDFLASPSMLAIFPLQDWLGIDAKLRRADRSVERINEPANPQHHWRYRVHIELDKLRDESAFNSAVSQLIKASNRYN